MFINLEDYEAIINQEELEVITAGSSIIRQKAEKMAIDKVRKFLNRQYNVDMIFSKIGADRDATILEYTLYFTLYILYSRIAKDKVPDDRYAQYKEALHFFESLKKDEISTDLPRKVNEKGETEEDAVRFGSNAKLHHYYDNAYTGYYPYYPPNYCKHEKS